MRVYEYAKQKNISTKEVVSLLKEGGFDVTSHMVVLDQDALDYLQKKLTKDSTVAPVSPVKKLEVSEVVERVLPQEEKHRFQEKLAPVPPISETAPLAPKAESRNSGKELGIIARSAMLSEIAREFERPVNELIVALLKLGYACTKNQMLPEELVIKLAKQYNMPILEAPKKIIEEGPLLQKSAVGDQHESRPPVVVVVGHVDHGKTTLLDFIRKTRVAAKEKGGITQHLGAYEASTPQGNIVFLDTPGHEAFSKIRARGLKVADIAVLVIAADDGIMPQTLEAIKYIKTMAVPVVVAINKVDKVPAARIDIVKRQCAQYDLVPEDWGGDVICVPISAKTGMGVDYLLEMILLQAQIMELRADVSGLAQGYVLEAKLEKGRGVVATIICQKGTMRVGDYFKAGLVVGKVSSLVDSQGKRLKEVGPSIPVLVAGFEELPEAGDVFEVIDKEEIKKARLNQATHRAPMPWTTTTTELFNLVVKTDTNSSKEALLGAIEKLSKKLEKGYRVVSVGIGNITDSDVEFAANTHASIVLLHTKPEPSALQLASKLGVPIKRFDIIYKLLEDLESVSESAKEIKLVKTKIGEATVLKVFDIKNLGVIAGSYVKEGRFSKDGTVVIYRGAKKIGEGSIKSLQRDRKSVKEVHTGYECAFLVEGFTQWRPDDRVECYLELPEGTK
jgi:translation initiation factor IF-2